LGRPRGKYCVPVNRELGAMDSNEAHKGMGGGGYGTKAGSLMEKLPRGSIDIQMRRYPRTIKKKKARGESIRS